MQPQTNAELIAWNMGDRAAERDVRLSHRQPTVPRIEYGPLTLAERQSRDVLGPELFWQWADRGYVARISLTANA